MSDQSQIQSSPAVAGGETKPTGEWTAWWSEVDADGCWHIGTGDRGFADLGEGSEAQRQSKLIADAHNAELAAEKLKYDDLLVKASIDGVKLREQLAAADKIQGGSSEAGLLRKQLAEAKRVAEAQQPLVDALVALRDGPQRLTEWSRQVIEAALVKVKEGK